jgi:hypothetical protein
VFCYKNKINIKQMSGLQLGSYLVPLSTGHAALGLASCVLELHNGEEREDWKTEGHFYATSLQHAAEKV